MGAGIQRSSYTVESNLHNSAWLVSPPTDETATALKKSKRYAPLSVVCVCSRLRVRVLVFLFAFACQGWRLTVSVFAFCLDLPQYPRIERRSNSLTKNQKMRRLFDKARNSSEKLDMSTSRSFDAGAMAKRAVGAAEVSGRAYARSSGGGTPPQYKSPRMNRSSSAEGFILPVPMEPLNCTSAQGACQCSPPLKSPSPSLPPFHAVCHFTN